MAADAKPAAARLRPRDAGTLILVRRSAEGPQVLMGQRHGDLVFMPNKFVFPGGRVSRDDSRLAATTALRPDVAERLRYKTARCNVAALALAAIRETFEETGLVIGRQQARQGMRTQSASEWAAFLELGFEPALDRLDFVARAITPTGRPRRFDARFFLTEGDYAQVTPPHDRAELLDVTWFTFDAALKLNLPSVTRAVIEHVRLRYEHPDAPPRTLFYRYRGEQDVIEYF